MRSDSERRSRRRFLGAGYLACVYLLLVVLALLNTLRSLRSEEFDGLNNFLQVPLAMPWFLLIRTGTNRSFNAFVDAGLGMVNASLLYAFLRLREARNRKRARYRWRTNLRRRLPHALIGLAPKGRKDCGQHEWYRKTGDILNCYHCFAQKAYEGEFEDEELAPG
jgi:hypothetical protein